MKQAFNIKFTLFFGVLICCSVRVLLVQENDFIIPDFSKKMNLLFWKAECTVAPQNCGLPQSLSEAPPAEVESDSLKASPKRVAQHEPFKNLKMIFLKSTFKRLAWFPPKFSLSTPRANSGGNHQTRSQFLHDELCHSLQQKKFRHWFAAPIGTTAAKNGALQCSTQFQSNGTVVGAKHLTESGPTNRSSEAASIAW